MALVDAVLEASSARLPVAPNVDYALAALAYVANWQPGRVEALFSLARMAGWLAHTLEEYEAPPLRYRLTAWRRAFLSAGGRCGRKQQRNTRFGLGAATHAGAAAQRRSRGNGNGGTGGYRRPPISSAAQGRLIDGVPVYWICQPGPLRAVLLFRTGQMDEALPWRGLTHLVEHLVLEDLGLEHDDINGSVSFLHTSFVTRGRPDEVATFVNGIVRAIRRLPLRQRCGATSTSSSPRIRARGPAPVGEHCRLRFGATGAALVNYSEFGLDGSGPRPPDRLGGHAFRSDNAALCLTGPPACRAWTCRRSAQVPSRPAHRRADASSRGPPFPAWNHFGGGMVSVSLLMPRNLAAVQAVRAVTEGLLIELRERQGVSYTVTHDWEVLGHDVAMATILADCRDENVGTVRDTMIAELSRFALYGPTPQVMASSTRKATRALEDPEATFPYLVGCALDVLMQRAVSSPHERRARLAKLQPGDLAAEVASALPTALWLVPRNVGVDDRRFHEVLERSAHAVHGHPLHRPPGTIPEAVADRLIVGPLGVSIVPGNDPSWVRTVSYANCEALLCWPDGVRALFGSDGISIVVHPGGWVNGSWAVSSIDHAVPAHLRVHRVDPFGTPATMQQPGQGPALPMGHAKSLLSRVLKR